MYFSVVAKFAPIRKDEVAYYVQEQLPMFSLSGKRYELRSILFGEHEERKTGVLRVIAANVIDAGWLYESQLIGVLCVKCNEDTSAILYGKAVRVL
jgi:hypothetical protein